MTRHKLFFALRPDPASAERIAQAVTAEHQARGLAPRLRPSRIFHITLFFFGNFEGPPEPGLVELVRRVAGELDWPSFELRFDRFASWGNPEARRRPFVLTGGQGLELVREFQAELGRHLAAHGFVRSESFEPHLTLRYDPSPAATWSVDLPGWVASDFVLIDSPQGETRHDVIARWPLQP
jgi:2'-5' RNA ligase